MDRVSGTRRWGLTAALFATALVFLVVAISTQSSIPLFLMWVPLLVVPFFVLGRPDPELRRRQAAGRSDADGGDGQPDTTGTDRG
jgi:hypothetical protein